MTTRPSNRQLIASGFIITVLLFTFAVPAKAYFAPSNGQAATLVLGQPNFASNAPATTQTGIYSPGSVAVDPISHKVFVADGNNSRVLRFASLYSLVNGAPAEAVFGQPNFTGHALTTTQSGMYAPVGISLDSAGRLWVGDSYNRRVLRFDNAASKPTGANADGVLGQPGFTTRTVRTTQNGMSRPYAVFADTAGRLWVADSINNRVLRFDNAAAKPNGANADAVLGQPSFTSSTPATTRNGMHIPIGLVLDAAGRLWVADGLNNRVLRFDGAAAKPNGANADGVLGQATFTTSTPATTQSGMNYDTGVTFDNATGRLWVADQLNNRVLGFNATGSLANGANASFVLGQVNFVNGTANAGGLSAASIYEPVGVFYDQTAKVLWVGDAFNNRVLMYGVPSRSFGARSSAADDGWVLESTETSSVGGSLSAAGLLRVGDDAGNRQIRSILSFDTSGLPDTAAIHSVTLKIKLSSTFGTDPFVTLGLLLGDIRNPSFGAQALEITDFQTPASADDVGEFTAISSQPGWYQLVVPAADYGFVDLTGVTQFRLRFKTDDNNNHIADFDTFFAGDAATLADRPLLSIEYSLP